MIVKFLFWMGLAAIVLLAAVEPAVLAQKIDFDVIDFDVTDETKVKSVAATAKGEIKVRDISEIEESVTTNGDATLTSTYPQVSDPKKAYSAEDIIALMIETMDKVETFRQAEATRINVSMTGRSDFMVMPLTYAFMEMCSENEIDLSRPAVRIDMSMKMGAEGTKDVFKAEMLMKSVNDISHVNMSISENFEDEEIVMYLAGDLAYMKIDGGWEHVDITEEEFSDLGDLQATNFVEDLSAKYAYIQDYSELELLGSEVVDGEVCYKLRLVPNATDPSKILGGQDYTSQSDESMDLTEIYDDVDVNTELEEILWISEDTHFLKKERSTGYLFESVITEDGMMLLLYADIDSTMYYSDYNQPIVIEVELPPELNIPRFIHPAFDFPAKNLKSIQKLSDFKRNVPFEIDSSANAPRRINW